MRKKTSDGFENKISGVFFMKAQGLSAFYRRSFVDSRCKLWEKTCCGHNFESTTTKGLYSLRTEGPIWTIWSPEFKKMD